jgi:tetratricopeptide (TPR) repeat protein
MDIENALVRLSLPDEVFLEKIVTMSPNNPWSEKVKVKGITLADKPLFLLVADENGNVLLDIIQKRDADEMRLDKQAALPESGSAEDYYQQGLKHENFDNREQAKQAYKKALSLSNTHQDAHLRYGLMLLRSAQFSEAAVHFSQASKLGNLESHLYTAQIALLLSNLDEAEEQFMMARTIEPLAASALMGLGKIAMRRKSYEKAIDYFQEACNRSEESETPELLLGIALRLSGKLEEAHTQLQNVLLRDPLNLLALHEIVEGKYSESKAVEKKLHRLLMDDFAYFTDLSCSYLDTGLPEVALDVLQAAWKHNPTAMVAYLAGYVSYLLDNKTESITWLEKARNASPEFGFPSRLEDVLALEFALKENQNDLHAKYFLGNFCYAHERYDEGIQLWLESLTGLAS